MDNDGKNYIKAIVFLIGAFVAFMGAVLTGYFSIASLAFGQAIFEVEVLEDRYTYECLTNCNTPATATYNTSDTLPSYDTYVSNRDALNALAVLFLAGFTIVFALLGIVFLMIALESAGLVRKNKAVSKEQY